MDFKLFQSSLLSQIGREEEEEVEDEEDEEEDDKR